MTVLGTDGFGLSDSRSALRDFFEVSAEHMAYAAMENLYRVGELKQKALLDARKSLGIDPDSINAADR